MKNSQKTNGEQTATGKFAPGNKIGNRFQKGETGNPNGRPKLTKLSESLRQQIAETNPDAPEETVAEQIAQTLIKLAIGGDVAAIKEIGNRTEGLPKQAIDLDLQVYDWRAIAADAGLTEEEFLYETRLFIDKQLDTDFDSE
jgi:hypothetical protein